MNTQNVEHLLRSIGAQRISVKIRAQGPMIRACCPLAPWTHSSGADSHPSFAIFAKDQDLSFCKCYGCKFQGSLRTLIGRIEQFSGRVLEDVHQFIEQNDRTDMKPRYDRLDGGVGLYRIVPQVNPQSIWTGGADVDLLRVAQTLPDLGPSAASTVIEMQKRMTELPRLYLNGNRRLSDQTITSHRIGYHPGANRISIPQYDFDQRLVNIGGRQLPLPWIDDSYPWMHSDGFKKDYYLFGEDRLNLAIDVAFLVEGMFDVIYLTQAGLPNVIGMLGSYLSLAQMEKIVRWFKRLVIIPDGDRAGWEARDRIFDKLSPRIPVTAIPVEEGMDPDQLSDEEISTIKREYNV